MAFENFPYTNFHEINLDWIVARVKEAYSASNPPDYPVKSVNGMTGDVIIAIPANLVSSVNGETGDVVLYRNPLTQFPSTDEQRWNLFRICDGYERGIEFDEDGAHRIEGTRRILIYDAENQPDFPVTSVNGQTGDVRISAGVNSVNGKTGNVVTPFINPNTDILKLDSNSNTVLWGLSRDVAGGNVALYITSGGGSPQAFIRFTPTEGEAINLPLLTNADIPESAGVISVNTKTGAVTLYGTDILTNIDSNTTVGEDIITERAERVEETSNIDYGINGLANAAFNSYPGNAIVWRTGSLRPTNGNVYSSSISLRSDRSNTFGAEYAMIKAISPNWKIAMLLWDSEDNYVGILDQETMTVAPAEGFTDRTYSIIDIASVAKKYPDYTYRLVIRDSNQQTITPEDTENNIALYTVKQSVSPDISELEETVAGHTTQITALEETDDSQDQQISALQAANLTQDQRLSALETDDSAHAQQIASLQSADATHNQQITDLYNASVTQGNQINDLYTRTGVYGIFIENVNSLPLRYPASGTDPKIKSTNMVVSMDLYVSGAQVDAWTITTYDGYLEITGTMNGVSSMTLYLA